MPAAASQLKQLQSGPGGLSSKNAAPKVKADAEPAANTESEAQCGICLPGFIASDEGHTDRVRRAPDGEAAPDTGVNPAEQQLV